MSRKNRSNHRGVIQAAPSPLKRILADLRQRNPGMAISIEAWVEANIGTGPGHSAPMFGYQKAILAMVDDPNVKQVVFKHAPRVQWNRDDYEVVTMAEGLAIADARLEAEANAIGGTYDPEKVKDGYLLIGVDTP